MNSPPTSFPHPDSSAGNQPPASYFYPPEGYFWHWAEEYEVVEWILGTTITYREELHALLSGLAADGLPPLGPVLLTLAACTHAWQESSAEVGLLQGLLHNLPPGGPPDEELLFHLSVARTFLDTIRQLPAGLRTGTAKEQLLRVLLAEDSAPRQVPARQAPTVVKTLTEVGWLIKWLTTGPPLTRQQLRADLLYFDRASRRFPTVHSLELRLRTGLDEVPAPPEELPVPPPAAPSADLLAELAQDVRTAPLARLVPHLQAALRLPRTTRQAGEQPLGGVADLSNRGPLDRLLLSELAQDDLSLLARLANAEALYLRREEPPLPHPPPRVLLLDVTLPMWGQPRVLGLAAALALAAPPGQPATQAFALEQLSEEALDLRSRAGVVDALSLLNPARHCGAALLLCLLTLPAGVEALLITETQVAQQLDFLSFLKLAPPALRFLLTVSRTGELVLSELAGGRRTELSRSQLDVPKLLHPARQRPQAPAAAVVLPAFLRQHPAPLRFPTGPFVPEYDPRSKTTAAFAAMGLVAVLPSQRVLYWPGSNQGAIELLPVVEAGDYTFGFSNDGPAKAYLLVRTVATGQLLLYTLYLHSLEAKRVEVDLAKIPGGSYYFRTTRFEQGTFQLEGPGATLLLGCDTGLITSAGPKTPEAPAPPFERPPHYYLNVSHQVLRRMPRLGLDAQGLLTVGDWQLTVANGLLEWRPGPDGSALAQPAILVPRTPPLTGNKRVRFHLFRWPDGSEAIADGRGLLHLRSADAALPEVTLVLAVNTATAAWASDGQVTGWNYYTTKKEADSLPVAEFYSKYIQPFVNQILRGSCAGTHPH